MAIELAEYELEVKAFGRKLDETPPALSALVLRPEAWSLKQLVGHLIDSASNNHQRFVRLQQADLEAFPGYEQEEWILIQKYNDYEWKGLVELWSAYNRLLLHVIRSIDPGKLGKVWKRPDGAFSLEWLIEDYYRHLGWHADHYARRLAELA